MPVIGDRSSSPPERNLDRANPVETGRSHAGPSGSKPKHTVIDLQKYKLERLMANPDKEVVTIPEKPIPVWQRQRAEKQVISNNAISSAAAAGSGEFHVYKHGRRREYERIKHMEQTSREMEEQAAFKARQEAREAEAAAKTAKNRAKRQKRKQGRKGGHGEDAVTPASAPVPGGGLKRKLEGGGAVNFRRPGEESDGEDHVAEKESGPDSSVIVPPVAAQTVQVSLAQESEIRIVDEDG